MEELKLTAYRELVLVLAEHPPSSWLLLMDPGGGEAPSQVCAEPSKGWLQTCRHIYHQWIGSKTNKET